MEDTKNHTAINAIWRTTTVAFPPATSGRGVSGTGLAASVLRFLRNNVHTIGASKKRANGTRSQCSGDARYSREPPRRGLRIARLVPAGQAKGEGEAHEGQVGEHDHHRVQTEAIGDGSEDRGAHSPDADR
jgi:hypothetical protein